jgi:hypothetical protein
MSTKLNKLSVDQIEEVRNIFKEVNPWYLRASDRELFYGIRKQFDRSIFYTGYYQLSYKQLEALRHSYRNYLKYKEKQFHSAYKTGTDILNKYYNSV